jgi:hypothetical protein
MPPHFLRVNALTRADRHATIPALRDAVIKSGGWITDARFFSNTSVCINLEIGLRHVPEFRAALGRLRLSLSEESLSALEDLGRLAAAAGERDAEAEVVGTLQVTFIHDEPDLIIEVPPIPG